jgi:dTDP-4-amino-4,6-dideoxygalactose transaminase
MTKLLFSRLLFAATANAVIHAGGIPIFADCEKETMNMDPQAIEQIITSKTKAIIPVHFAGRPWNMDVIMSIATKYGLKK